MGKVFFKLSFSIVLVIIIAITDCTYAKDIEHCSSIDSLSDSEIIPLRYDIQLTIKPFMRMISGKVDITFNIDKPKTEFTRNQTQYYNDLYGLSLHARGLKPDIQHTIIRKVASVLDDPKTYKLVDFTYCKDEILILMFKENLKSGNYSLHIEYISALNTNEDIFYPYIWTKDDNKWLFTNLYTTNATLALFPCWNRPELKSIYNISIKHPTDYAIFFNLPTWKTSFDEFGMQWTHYKDFVWARASSLAIALIDDVTRNSKHRGIHFIWHKAKAGKIFIYAHEMAEESLLYFKHKQLHTLNNILKIDHVIVPNSPMKSMGRFGLIIYREKDITYDKDSDFSGRSIDVAKLMAYEMARQVFVTLNDDKIETDWWINEMLSSFYSYYILDQMRKTDRLMELFTVQIIQPALDTDIFIGNKLVIHKPKDNDGIDSLLYSLLYHKKVACQQNLNPSYYYFVRTEDLWTVMEIMFPRKRRGDVTIKEIMNSWLTVRHHPEVYVDIIYNSQIAICNSTSVKENEWNIPLNYILSSNLEFYDVSNVNWFKHSIQIAGPKINEFLLVNLEQTGYYRVNYLEDNWRKIITELRMNKFTRIPVLTRAQLINDAYYFTMKGEFKKELFLHLITYLKNHTDYIAWYPVFKIMSYTSAYFEFEESYSLAECFKKLLDVLLDTVGYEPQSGDDGMKTSLILLARKWACDVNLYNLTICLKCTNTATKRLENYIETNELNKIPPISRHWILCSGLMTAKESVWNDVLKAGINYESMEILEYLSCSENPNIIINYLNQMLQQHYFTNKTQFMRQILRTIVKKHVRKYPVLFYVIRNYDAILNRFPIDFYILISDMIMNVYERDQLNMIKDFVYNKYSWDSVTQLTASFDMLIDRRKMYLNAVREKFKNFN